MNWPWARDHHQHGEKPNPERARRRLEQVRRQRPEAERLAAEIRELVRRNNFAANVFALDPDKRDRGR